VRRSDVETDECLATTLHVVLNGGIASQSWVQDILMGRTKRLAWTGGPRYTESVWLDTALSCPHVDMRPAWPQQSQYAGFCRVGGWRNGDLGDHAVRDDLCKTRSLCVSESPHRFPERPIAGRKEVIVHIRMALCYCAQARVPQEYGRWVRSVVARNRIEGPRCDVLRWGARHIPVRQVPGCVKGVPNAIHRGWGLGANPSGVVSLWRKLCIENVCVWLPFA